MDGSLQWEGDVLLADGAPMHVRPIRPGDGPLLSAFHARQSAESIYFRYFSPRPTLSERDLEHLTVVDYVDRMAFIGLLGDEMVGIARYDRYPTSSTAEVAFFTDDAHHGRGMATVLLEYLAAAAREVGLTGFVAQVLPQNRRMLGVFKQAGFEVHSHFEEGVIEVELSIEPTETARAMIEERARTAFAVSARRLLAPGTIAVVGASRRPDAVGHRMLARLLDGDFSGPVYPVNRAAPEVLGVPAWPSVLSVPDDIDLAVVCVPAAEVRSVVLECARKHVRGLMIVSAGFSESGRAGLHLEQDVVTLAHRHGMRVIGPNSMGVVNTAADVSMHATFVEVETLAGSIGVSSQSGTLGAAIIGHASRLGLGVSTFVSLGNKADVSNNDLLQYWEDDDATRLVLLHLDSFGNPQNFARITRRLTRLKPVVAVKSGRAVQLAETSDGVPLEASLDALLAQTGVIRVDTLEQLFDVAVLLTFQPVPTGRRLAIVSNSWGPASLACDAAIGAGLDLAVRDGGGLGNPLDLGYAIGPDEFAAAVARACDDPAVDAVLVLCTPTIPNQLGHFAEAISDAVASASVPVVASYLGLPPKSTEPTAHHLPVFEFPEAAVHALGRMARYGEWLARDVGELPEPTLIAVDDVRAIVDVALADPERDPAGWLPSGRAADLLAAAGISVVARREVGSADEAVDAAGQIGWPVALKASGVARPAKTEAGGIAVDVHDDVELRHAYARMADLLDEAMHPAVVQEMAPSGVDLRVGMVRHNQVGSVVTVGAERHTTLAGTQDAVQVLPCSDRDADQLVTTAGVDAALASVVVRGSMLTDDQVSAGRAALAELVLRLSVLGEVAPEVDTVMLDPVLVSHEGAWVTDVRLRLVAEAEPVGPDVRRLTPDRDG